jgi:hypothetical protein
MCVKRSSGMTPRQKQVADLIRRLTSCGSPIAVTKDSGSVTWQRFRERNSRHLLATTGRIRCTVAMFITEIARLAANYCDKPDNFPPLLPLPGHPSFPTR